MKRFVASISVLLIAFTSIVVAQGTGRFTIDDLLKVRRVSDPQVSPDGKSVAFSIGDVNFDANRIVTHIYLMPIAGGNIKQLTSGDSSASGPRWSPDGKKIAYVTGGQIWVMDHDGDDKKQVTKIATGASGPVWSPDSKWIAFTSEVYPECADEDCNRLKEEQAAQSKVKAHLTDRLLYRHWVEWRDVKRTHVFIIDSQGGNARDLTPGDFDAPPYAVAGDVDYSFSPDSKELAYLRNPDKVEAISTNSDVYLIPTAGGAARNITVRNRGYEDSPIYTRDGKRILYRSQATAGFEADRWRLMSYNRATGTSAELLKGFDLNVEDFLLSPDGNTIYFLAGERGLHTVYKVAATGGGAAQRVLNHVFATNLQITPDGQTLVFANSSLAAPPEIMKVGPEGTGLEQLTRVNAEIMSRAALTEAEEMEWTGALGKKIHGFLLKPRHFDQNRKYPLAVWIHGGPQSAWNNSWSYRWNPQVFTDAGYVVFMPNPRGSLGYGQQFVNEISADWGGKVFIDLKNGIAEVLRRNSYVDKNRIGGAGASYGGYMVDWILGHNNDPRFKFKALVSHAGVYNLTSMYGATEELWFVEWEFKGTPWSNPAMYQRWSPHMYAQNFNTPTLVTAGELDYRVPYTESLQLFTALQRRGVESKLLIFPDEGHWILKPQNSHLWYRTVLDWFDKHLK
jgi:dipeptidyl aminopeptidase/acylaminoacyl peptidase